MSDNARKSGSLWSSALILAVMAAVCTALVALTYTLTGERIADNQQAFLEESLQPVLAGIEYDGPLSDSTMIIPVPHDLPGNQPATVYRVFEDEAPLAALFVVVARDGYAGPIRLLIGLTDDGRITRARVIEHRETPGLGDRIEAGRSDWINQFDGRSLADPTEDMWKIRRDGGEFDQLSGASITSRSVVKALRETLIYFNANHDAVFAPDADTDE